MLGLCAMETLFPTKNQKQKSQEIAPTQQQFNGFFRLRPIFDSYKTERERERVPLFYSIAHTQTTSLSPNLPPPQTEFTMREKERERRERERGERSVCVCVRERERERERERSQLLFNQLRDVCGCCCCCVGKKCHLLQQQPRLPSLQCNSRE